MRVLIVGAGAAGYSLASQLSREGHDVSLVESDENRLKAPAEKLDVLTIHGDALSPSVLRSAGIEETELLVAITGDDAANLVLCQLAGKFGVPRKIARIRNGEYYGEGAVLGREELGIDLLINPEEETVGSIIKMIQTPGATDVAEFADGQLLLRGFVIPPDSPLAGKRLEELRPLQAAHHFLIAGITQGETFRVPRGEDRLAPGDHIIVLILKAHLAEFLKLTLNVEPGVRKVVIHGATLIGRSLARQLADQVGDITLVEKDVALAETAAEDLEQVEVIRGAATEPDVMGEVQAESADFFAAVSDDLEENIFSALLAKKRGAKKVAVLTADQHVATICRSIGIDAVINSQQIVVGAILRYIRRGDIKAVFRLEGSESEVIELIPPEGSRIVGRPLAKVRFPAGALVGAVEKEGRVQIADGQTVIQPGERVIVFAVPAAIKKVEKIFARKGLLV